MKRIIITVEEVKPGMLAIDCQPEDGPGTQLEIRMVSRINNAVADRLHQLIGQSDVKIVADLETSGSGADSLGAQIIQSAKEGFRRK